MLSQTKIKCTWNSFLLLEQGIQMPWTVIFKAPPRVHHQGYPSSCTYTRPDLTCWRRIKRFHISPLLANYTVKWLLMSCAFWGTTRIFFDVRHDGDNSCLLVVRLDRDNSWSLRFWAKLTCPHFTTQENLWFLFQEVKKKKKKTGDWCFCVRIKTLSTAWWVTKGKLNFPLLKSLL